MDDATIITVASTLLVIVVTGLIAFIVSNTKGSHKKRVMSVIRGEDITDLKSRDSSVDARREALAKKLRETSDADKKEKKGATLPLQIIQAGLEISVKQYFLFSVLSSVLATGAMFAMGKGPFVLVMAAVIGFFGIPRFVLKRLILRRQKKFLNDLADVFESMVRLLKAGMPVSEAIRMVSREFTGPIAEEMGRIFDQQKIGVPLAEAVQSCAERVPLTEVQMFATAITIQSQTGSSLSEVFENLARTVRSRYRLKRKVNALSSEAKSSAMIIAALPVFVALAMYFINPDYIGLLFSTNTGKFLLSGALFWMGCGVLMMRQMINFKV